MTERQPGVITTSDEVRTTYYGEPVINMPHWRWLVIVYFFLAALAGGGFTVATIADLFSRERSLVRLGRYLSVAAVLPAPVLLALDLGRPERAFHMFRILKLRSPMSLGSWALLGLGNLAGLSAVLQVVADLSGRNALAGPRRILGILGLPFSVFVMGYTGVLLAATNVPLWARNYLLLGPTFIASAFSSTLSALSLLLHLTGGDDETLQRVRRAEVVCLGVEMVALAGSTVRLGRLGRPLTTGFYGAIFWPVTVVSGLLVPFLLQIRGPAAGRPASHPRGIATSLLVLLGGFSLRALMIFAGRKSAARPEDYFEYTRARS